MSSLAGAAIAGYALIRRPWANRLDAAGFAALPANPNDLLYHEIAKIGSLPVLLVGIALSIVLSIWRDWPRAIACVIGPLAAVVITEQASRSRSSVATWVAFGGDSYPSGTVTAAAALVTVVTARRACSAATGCRFRGPRRHRRRWRRGDRNALAFSD